MIERIAKIQKAQIGYEDHGLLTVFVDLDYGGGSHQGVPGYGLCEPTWRLPDGTIVAGSQPGAGLEFAGRRGTAWGLEFIRRIMEAAGVDRWEKVEGRTVLALLPAEGRGHMVVGLRPLPTEPGTEVLFDSVAADAGLEEVDG